MPNLTTPRGARFTGWFRDLVTPAAKLYLNGTLVATVAGNDLSLADKLTVTGTCALVGVPTIGAAYALPVADGSNTNQLQTDGNGTVTWEAKA